MRVFRERLRLREETLQLQLRATVRPASERIADTPSELRTQRDPTH
jgi:hypothetical protein